jgi:hypothetical protein
MGAADKIRWIRSSSAANTEAHFKNAFVRVIDDVIPPGRSEPKHRHPHGMVIAVKDAETDQASHLG